MNFINILIFALTFCPLSLLWSQTLPAPTGLTVEYLRAPKQAVVTDPNPDFGWIFPAAGIRQTAYRILVASSPFLLREDKADLWDSGVIKEPNSVNIEYGGATLQPHSVYWWQVKVWSNHTESDYCAPAQFITGNFDRSGLDYAGQSKWIELAADQWVSEDKQSATFHRFTPERVIKGSDGKYFVDFGKSAIGILEFTATALKDTPVDIHLGERKNDDLTVHKQPGRSNIGYEHLEMTLKSGTHHYVLQLEERRPSGYLHSQKLAPHYPEVMPFRYVDLAGDPEFFIISEFKQAALYYYFDEDAASFYSSDQKLNQVWDLCKYTLKATPFLGVYADGNRERMPYEADANIQQLGHYAVDREYAISKYTINFLLDHASWPTEWQMHMVLMAWDYFMYTGDTTLLKDRYEDLKQKSLIGLTDDSGLISTRTGKKTIEFVRSLNYPGELEKFRDIVDWPHGAQNNNPGSHRSPLPGGETDGFVFTDYNSVVNAFHYRSLVLMAQIAGVVGNQVDEDFFRRRANDHRKIFLRTFFKPEQEIFRDGEATEHASLHANMFPLAFGLVPVEKMPSVVEFIKSRGMACSVYGSQYLLDALFAAGEANYALELMTSEDKRSWLNMIKVGSSMTTEAWDEYYKPNLTWNHAWGSAPANITSRKLMGIEPLTPSFEKFRISPQPGYLDTMSIQVPTIRGFIVGKLKTRPNEWNLKVEVPGNSTAEIWLPDHFTRITINGRPVKAEKSGQFAGGQRKVYTLLSGKHDILALAKD